MVIRKHLKKKVKAIGNHPRVRKLRPQPRKKHAKEAVGDSRFWVIDGPVLSTIFDLLKAFERMSKGQYDHHVGNGRNNFADWTKDILHDDECAADLRKAHTRTASLRVLRNHTKKYHA